MVNEVTEWYIESGLLTVKMLAETDNGFRYDLIIVIDRQSQTYNYIDNPHFENEKIKNENQISNAEMEVELAVKVLKLLKGLYMEQRLISDPKYREYTDSILSWL